MTAAAIDPKAPIKKLKGEDVGVPVRRMDLEFSDDIPQYWFRDNAFLTMFFAGFSAALPEGEKEFIESVRLFQDKITDPVLKAQVRAFIGQEAHHGKEHETFNKMLARKNPAIKRIIKFADKMTITMAKRSSAKKRLAMTVASEHITALLSEYFISHDRETLDNMPEQVGKIWGWHAIEETEHKAVAFDVYDQVVGDRTLLRLTMAEATFFFILFNTYNSYLLMRETDQMTNFKMWREAGSFLTKMSRTMAKDYMDFFKKDYHPWQHDNRADLADMKAKYLGESA